MIITSKDNETIKSIKKLKEKKYRTESFIVEGIKMVKEALEQAEVEKIIVSETFSNSDDFKGLNCDEQKLIIASDKVFEDLTDVVTPQGIIAVVKKGSNSEIDYNDEFVLALDGIQDRLAQRNHSNKQASADMLICVAKDKYILADAKFRQENVRNISPSELESKLVSSKSIVESYDYMFANAFYVLFKKRTLKPTQKALLKRKFSGSPQYRFMNASQFYELFER